jgi:tetratricopeptide (TPR) repeat protein
MHIFKVMNKDIKKYIPWIILAVVVVVLSTLFLLSKRITQEQLSKYEKKVGEAQMHMEARQYSVAVEKYYEAVDIIPSKVDAYEGLIKILLQKNRLKEAEEVIEKSAKPLSSFDKSLLYKRLGDEYYYRKDFRKAYEMYDDGLVLGVKNMGLELALGKVLLNLGDVSSAKKQFLKTGYEGEENLESNLLLSYIYALDDTPKAKKVLKSVDPSEKSQVYYDEFEDTLNNLNEDVKYNVAKLARVYINNGYPFLAISAIEPIKEDISEYLEAMYFLGRAYLDYGQYDEAIEALDSSLTLGGMETDILWAKGRAYMLKNDLDSGMKNYESAIGYSGGAFPKELVEEYVKILLDNKQTLKATEVVKNLLLLKDVEAYLNLLATEIYFGTKEYEKVDYYLDQLAKMSLNKTEEKVYLQFKIRMLLREKVDIDEYLTRLLNVDKFNPYYHFFLAQVQIEDGDESLAVESLERAIEYDLNSDITEEASELLSSLR